MVKRHIKGTLLATRLGESSRIGSLLSAKKCRINMCARSYSKVRATQTIPKLKLAIRFNFTMVIISELLRGGEAHVVIATQESIKPGTKIPKNTDR